MNRNFKYTLVIVLVIMLIGKVIINSFRKENVTSLETVLQVAGENRQELEKVLRYYKKNSSDSLKYKAACFLIENIPFYTYSDGEQLENYKFYYTWLKKSKGKTPQQVVDSIKKIYGPMKEPSKKRDIMEIDSAYLCHNIDWAFKVWQEQPWGKENFV